MLAKKYRLPWGVKFNKSRSFSAPEFRAKLKSNTCLFSRFGVIISKKIDRRAVYRNRIRRLIYSIVEELYDNIGQGYDMLIIMRKNAAGKTREDLYVSIKNMLLTEGLLQ